MEPYRGLQPYTEENEDIFFGREAEKAIVIDKILSDKLTLLFAATGVGKSSLLQAAVMPELKRPARENLDVVYYNDWVTPPLEGLTRTILDTLKARGKIGDDFLDLLVINDQAKSLSRLKPAQEEDFLVVNDQTESSSRLKPDQEEAASDHEEAASTALRSEPGDLSPKRLKDFLHLCATFASEPLVIILDQFEEFFQYQRYSEDFTPFIAPLSEALRDRETPAAFLISMREDFALNLNAFKSHLPTILFENYYRLEKLDVSAARATIEEPVKKVGFRFEQGLLEDLLKDLAEQERENRIGTQKELIPEQAPAFVEPPNVQIVCTQLWALEKSNPDKQIRAGVYREHGGSKGFINDYFTKVISAFSQEEKKLASKAFDHLVTPRGTKMAYPVRDLSDKLRVEEKDLGAVLTRLEKARVLRSQERKGELWYELYHDTFSGIIHAWNSEYKARQRTKRALRGVGIAAISLFFLFVAYDIIINFSSYHFRLSPKEVSTQIELYHGKSNSWDIAYLHRYEAETSYNRSQLEPDKQFIHKPLTGYPDMNLELIGNLPVTDRISEYWNIGEINKALELADKSISKNDMTRTQSVINFLADFRSQKAFKVLKKNLEFSEDDMYFLTSKEKILSFLINTAQAAIGAEPDSFSTEEISIRSSIISALSSSEFSGVTEYLIPFLKDQNPYGLTVRDFILASCSHFS